MIQVKSFTFNPVAENTYVLYDETREAVIIDPGNYEAHENQHIDRFILDNQLIPIKIINTHAHFDHVLGVSYVKNKYNIPFALSETELPLLRAVKSYAPNYGFHLFDEPEVDEFIPEDQIISFGNSSLIALFVPGHSPGHLAFYSETDALLIGGDVLFRQSIGRTDLPGGNHQQLLTSIRTKLFTLDEATTVYPGHGGPTTIGYEKKHNPFFS